MSAEAVGNQVEIDFEASTEITANPALGRIAQSFTQLEEKLERERLEKVEKERKIQELQMNNRLVSTDKGKVNTDNEGQLVRFETTLKPIRHLFGGRHYNEFFVLLIFMCF